MKTINLIIATLLTIVTSISAIGAIFLSETINQFFCYSLLMLMGASGLLTVLTINNFKK